MTTSKGGQRIAVYAGTFDPITNGHRDIVERAITVFDRVYMAVAESSAKNPLFSADERKTMITAALADLGDRVIVDSFNTLLVDYVRSVGAKVIIRGLRAVSDYEYEAQMAMINRHLAEEIETVFLMTSDHCSFINSSIVRQVAKFGGDVSALVPKNVAEVLRRKFS